jgi:hypothetical protein
MVIGLAPRPPAASKTKLDGCAADTRKAVSRRDSMISITCLVTIDWLVLLFQLLHQILCYNQFQRYCHGLLVTR